MATDGYGIGPGAPGGTIVKSAFGISGAASPSPEPEPEPLNPDADIRRLVTIDSAGSVTEILPLETADTYLSVRDTFTVKPADRKPAEAGIPRRYQGTRIINETHGNAAVTWKALVKGETADDAIDNIEQLITEFERCLNQPDVYLEWVPAGASRSTYYEVRGPARWATSYRWVQFYGVKSMECDIEVPVGPLARGARVVQDLGSFAAPCVVQLPDPVGGSAPAAANITLAKGSGADNPAFGLLAWWKRLPTPPSGYSQCFGLIEADDGTDLDEFTIDTTVPSYWHNGSSITVDPQTASQPATARYKFSTAGLTGRTTDIEVWARTMPLSGVLSPRLAISATAAETTGTRTYSNEWGQSGAPVADLPGGTFEIRKLGTLTLPIAGVSNKWALDISLTWGVGSNQAFNLDWLVLVPARQRACSPTGESLDSAYPRFMPSGTGAAAKTVRSDLSGVSVDGTEIAADTGLGGALIELPPGDVDLMVLLSKAVPDGGGANDAKEIALTGGVEILERHFLLAVA